jgi:hypothetical protein
VIDASSLSLRNLVAADIPLATPPMTTTFTLFS